MVCLCYTRDSGYKKNISEKKNKKRRSLRWLRALVINKYISGKEQKKKYKRESIVAIHIILKEIGPEISRSVLKLV